MTIIHSYILIYYTESSDQNRLYRSTYITSTLPDEKSAVSTPYLPPSFLLLFVMKIEKLYTFTIKFLQQ